MNDIDFQKIVLNLSGKIQIVNIIKYNQKKSFNSTLLISKLSEAINPDILGNHIGEGSTIDEVFKHQSNIKFIINAGFSHYRKNFYHWKHQDYNIGDPVGIVKIREHQFSDFINNQHYGYFTQKDKNSFWTIQDSINNIEDYKYCLGCTPLLIHNGKLLNIPNEPPVPLGEINPPSYLGHGEQCHPRTAIGIKDDIIYFVNVENNPEGAGGCTLSELQSIGNLLELESFMNLDGGGSSQFRIIKSDGSVISNYVFNEDKYRVLGHAFIIFENQ